MFKRVQPVPRTRSAWRLLLPVFVAAVGLLAAFVAESSGAATTVRTAAPTFAQACGTQPVTLQGYF